MSPIAVRAKGAVISNVQKVNYVKNGIEMVRTSFTRAIEGKGKEIVIVDKDAKTGRATRMLISNGWNQLKREYKPRKKLGMAINQKTGRLQNVYETGYKETTSNIMPVQNTQNPILSWKPKYSISEIVDVTNHPINGKTIAKLFPIATAPKTTPLEHPPFRMLTSQTTAQPHQSTKTSKYSIPKEGIMA